MDFEQIIVQKIYQTQWELYKGPEYYRPERVPFSLSLLVQLQNEKLARKLCSDVMFALGNDHAGTFYPALKGAIPILRIVLEQSINELVRNCVLEIFSDWCFSFDAELGSYTNCTAEELEVFVRSNIKQTVFKIQGQEIGRNALLINDFMEYFREE